MKRWPLVGGALAVLWLFVRGVEPAPAPVAGALVTGLALGLPIAFFFRRFYGSEAPPGGFVRALPFVVIYLLTFLKELITANVDVAYRVLAPSMPIEPDVIELPLRVESDAAITTIANSITLTPGTLTMDYDEDRNSLYVHAIAAVDREAVVAPIRTWEDYALRIFDEERTPSDPVPDPDAPEPEDDSERATETDRDPGGETDGE
ncbi:Na+/H+ antiporter subunit E [Halorhabdus amylolytica]|uniref:Na+/H+ antiporter subunit E n=1 Tax=Halorhabdus amylolytica TaxID=2559573 RepID=UPI0010AA8197|nr:Na+/H+ antiporter subunit E [Halorhabdus amylolytica]